ncbi:competence protein ComK [Filibacter tadaridae]|uniref:Competence transcription factor n=1 Tax=Filibacter tadaridae TaxID=2483811 RepID=A0A3P5XX30_9BACL|nr:competence protein ComK [Filibacter tadaridae]VDC33676.1 Competence transcription factor [Filibacter tadaridae]
MKRSAQYIITYNTILFLPEYDDAGNLYTKVFDGGSPFVVEMNPTELIDFNLKYYGSSLKGARESANMILGDTKMHPVNVIEKLGIFWFPSKSPEENDCVWFALHHIENTIKLSSKETEIILSGGSKIIIAISKSSFEGKILKAYKLKGKLDIRTREMPMRVNESKGLYHIFKSGSGLNFVVIHETEE